MDTAFIIPAVKKNVAFYDDLMKKMVGDPLIQRAIKKAEAITEKKNIYIITDSEEIRLLSQRMGVHYYFDKTLKLIPEAIVKNLVGFLSTIADSYKTFVLLSPYAPLLPVKEIQRALNEFNLNKAKLLIPVKEKLSRIFTQDEKSVQSILKGETAQTVMIESQAFQIISSALISDEELMSSVRPLTYPLDRDLIEIQSYQDWWVCEKLLKRKRVVFRIIGNEQVGMGHIQRTLTLAHEITDHEIRFVCDSKSKTAADKLAGYDYWLGVYEVDEIEDQILTLEPDLVINDILNTSSDYIKKLRASSISVVNFEDLGEGAGLTNLTINELYDEPLIAGENILWGWENFFTREEFNDAEPNKFKEKVHGLLIMFGGTDPSDYTRKILRLIKDDCGRKNIKIYIITGGGYSFIRELESEINEINNVEIEYHHSIGVVSHVMEKVQVAISANGRTIYELAHMNIPAIVLSHHERENTHNFARLENGLIPIGIYKGVDAEKKVALEFQRLIMDIDFRKTLFGRLKPFNFNKNKERILNLIQSILKC